MCRPLQIRSSTNTDSGPSTVRIRKVASSAYSASVFACLQTNQRHGGVSLQWGWCVDQAPQLDHVAGGAVAECRFESSIDILGPRSLMAILFHYRLSDEKDFSSSTISWSVRKPTFLKLLDLAIRCPKSSRPQLSHIAVKRLVINLDSSVNYLPYLFDPVSKLCHLPRWSRCRKAEFSGAKLS